MRTSTKEAFSLFESWASEAQSLFVVAALKEGLGVGTKFKAVISKVLSAKEASFFARKCQMVPSIFPSRCQMSYLNTRIPERLLDQEPSIYPAFCRPVYWVGGR